MVWFVQPFFRSPFTDLTQVVVNNQHYDKCGEFEMAYMECMEAYGATKGESKCKDLKSDFFECFTATKQRNRSMVSYLHPHTMNPCFIILLTF